MSVEAQRAPAEPLRLGPPNGNETLERIMGDLLAEDMVRLDEALTRALAPQEGCLTDIEIDIYRRGKKVRPAMLLLCARMLHGDGPLDERVILAATSLEMLHVATMIHDDIIDDALVRRGLSSVNAKRGTDAAILVGDMQFVQAIRVFIDAIRHDSDMGLVKLVLDTAFRICVGELQEIETDPSADTATLRDRYFEVIERKTAIMFGLACETGVSMVGGRTSEARRIGFYGRRVGRAFQIIDDLLDFLQDESHSGKQRGTDLSRRCLSLPIIYAIDDLGPDHLVSGIVRGRDVTELDLRQGIEAVTRTDALDRAYADARCQAIDALGYIRAFPDNEYTSALQDIALFTVDRGF